VKVRYLLACVAVAAVGIGCDHDHAPLTDAGACPDGSVQLDAGDGGTPDASCVAPTAFGCFFQPGQDVWVDGFGGADDAGACCCGQPFVPCQTLTHSMAIIADGGTVGVQIRAYLSDGGDVWPNTLEVWPVHLGWGVSLTAPGVQFSPDPAHYGGRPGSINIFELYPYATGDTSRVTIQGDPADSSRQARLGLPLDGGVNPTDIAIADPPPKGIGLAGLPAQLSNLWLHATRVGIQIGANAEVILGPLPVHLGSSLQRLAVDPGIEGIDCDHASVRDTGTLTLQIDSYTADIVAHSGCSAALIHSPHLGLLPAGGFNSCPAKLDSNGLSAIGSATVMLGGYSEPAELHCFLNNGIGLAPDSSIALPSVTFVGNESNASCRGAQVKAGTLTALGSSFSYNQVGLWAYSRGAINIDGSTNMATPTRVGCNATSELAITACDGDPPRASPSNANVVIDAAATTQADVNDVIWNHWDTKLHSPETWTCLDDLLSTCACSGADCPAIDGGFPRPFVGPTDVLLVAAPLIDAGLWLPLGGSQGCP